MLRLAIVLV